MEKMESMLQTRPGQIVRAYDALINKHLDDLVNNRADKVLEIGDFADRLFIHHVHLSNTIKEATWRYVNFILTLFITLGQYL